MRTTETPHKISSFIHDISLLPPGRVKLLFKQGMSCYRERRGGMRKRKSVRGCIVGHDIAMLSLVISKKGDNEIAG